MDCAIKMKAVDKSDGRGRAISINKTAEEEIEFVKAHISTIPPPHKSLLQTY